jgi:hypothetical protein
MTKRMTKRATYKSKESPEIANTTNVFFYTVHLEVEDTMIVHPRTREEPSF